MFAGFVLVFLVIVFTFPRPAAIGLLILSGVLAILAGWGAWRAHYHPDEPKTAPALLSFKWERCALPTRSGGVFGSFGISKNSAGGVGLSGTIYSEQDHEIDWPSDQQDLGIGCQLINHEAAPLANLIIPVKVTFKKTIRRADLCVPGGNTYTAGGVTVSGDIWMRIPKLEPAPAKCVFYLFNDSGDFLLVDCPELAEYETLNDRTRCVTTLTRAGRA